MYSCFSRMLHVVVFLVYFLVPSSELSNTGQYQTRSPLVLRVETALICANRGDVLKIGCTLRSNNAITSPNDWILSWISDGRKIQDFLMETVTNNTVFTSTMTTYVTWVDHKVFTCVGRKLRGEDKEAFLNSSVEVHVRPPPLSIFGLRYVETGKIQKVEVFWRPTGLNSAVYTLKFCIEDSEDELIAACPNYNTVTSKCFVNNEDYYTLPNSTGFICKASFQSPSTVYTTHKVYISSKASECERKSAVRRFHLAFWRMPLPFQTTTELVLIPQPVTSLQGLALKGRRVRLSWSDPRSTLGKSSGKYTVRYKCSKGKLWSRKEFPRTNITLISGDIPHYHPYSLCRFCVTIKPYLNGIDSEPICAKVRLQEEIPTDAPSITCAGEECKSTSNGAERNVTITWTLPPREDWNGVLTLVKVFCKSAAKLSKAFVLSISNLTKSEATLRKLATNQSYIVQMVACNRQGCGGLGNASVIPALRRMYHAEEYTQEPRKRHLAVALAGSVGCLLLIFLVSYFIYMFFISPTIRRKPELNLQPCVSEQSSYDSVEEPGNDTVEYDKLDLQNNKSAESSVIGRDLQDFDGNEFGRTYV